MTAALDHVAIESFDAKQEMMKEHVGLVHHVARQLARRLHDEVEVDELVSAGAIGLAQAVESFERSRGLSFSTFAVPRIRGSMLDELRRQDYVPRSVRRKARAISEASQSLSRTEGREPTDDELATQLGIPRATLRQWKLDVEGSVQVSLDAAPRTLRRSGLHSAERVTAVDAIADERVPDLDERLSQERRIALVGLAIRRLRPQERRVLALYYYEELKLQQIARVLGLSTSRMSQLRSEAIANLRASLGSMIS
jgi:RNA polymerase sigma factor for flagellar operon FliA